MRYADDRHRECAAGRSAHHFASGAIGALTPWVGRGVAGQRERRFVRHNSLILRGSPATHFLYDIVLL